MIMRVNCDNLCLMLKDNNTSIPTRPPTTKNDLSIRRSLYRSSSRRDDINPIVPTTTSRAGKLAIAAMPMRQSQPSGAKTGSSALPARPR